MRDTQRDIDIDIDVDRERKKKREREREREIVRQRSIQLCPPKQSSDDDFFNDVFCC